MKLTHRTVNYKSFHNYKKYTEENYNKNCEDWTLRQQLEYLHNLDYFITYCFFRSLNRSKYISNKIRTNAQFAAHHKTVKNSKLQLLMNRQKRQFNIDVATPKWVNKKEIEAVYKQRDKIEKMTGKKYHVDHIVPLVGKDEFGNHIVCGLNVIDNLQIITAEENLKKWCYFNQDQFI